MRMGRRTAARIVAALEGSEYDQNYDGVDSFVAGNKVDA